MKQLANIKKKLPLLLLIGILIICAGFILINCGKGPKKKVLDPNAGQFAIDFSDCPSSILCRVIIASGVFKSDPTKSIQDKETTLEAWVKFKDTSSGAIFGHMDASGAALYVSDQGHSTSTTFTSPKFIVRRVATNPLVTNPDGSHPTSSVDHIVDSGFDISSLLGKWTHIAGVLVDKNHSSVHADCLDYSQNPPVVTNSARGDSPHIDIYINGVYRNCAKTYGNLPHSTSTVPVDDATGPAFTQDPSAGTLAVGVYGDAGDAIEGTVSASTSFSGAVDEVRLWASDRTDLLITCMNRELAFDNGDCGYLNDELVAYFRFNEGKGEIVTEWTGLGSAGKEYPNTNPPPEVFDWTSGWISGVPSLKN